jgi:hypothetical protein
MPRGATIRLAGTASEGDAAVVADGITDAELVGFRIVGDAATPLGTGVLVRDSDISLIDVDVTGAVNVAIDISGPRSRGSIVASDVHDNPGAALAIRSEASPRLAHDLFTRNGGSEHVQAAFVFDAGVAPRFSGNVFRGVSREAFADLDEATRASLTSENWFAEPAEPRSSSSTGRHGRSGRQ